jgi:succinoglycan biosynthesis protein ExoO
MRFAFVTDELPRPGTAGHLALNHAILAWLREAGHQVTVLLVGTRLSSTAERYDATVAGPHIRIFQDRVVPASPAAVCAGLARGALKRLPARLSAALRAARNRPDAVLGKFCSAEDAGWCARWIAAHRPDAVLIDTIFRTPVLRRPELAGMPSVLVAHDVFHLRHRALTSAGYRVQPARLSREDEAACAGLARHIAAIQPEEARLLAQLCPASEVFTAGMPARPCPPPPGRHQAFGRLVFIGSASLPNLDGLRWFFAEVWPKLEGSGATLDLIGDCGAALRDLPSGVQRLGRVPDLAPVLHRARLAIAPLRVGSGLKIKLLDYARHGLVTVATPASLDGFASDDEFPFLPAAGAAGFAAAIRTALADPALGASARALAYVARHYGREASFAGLAEALGLPARSPAAE